VLNGQFAMLVFLNHYGSTCLIHANWIVSTVPSVILFIRHNWFAF